jgi:hypothetical protein
MCWWSVLGLKFFNSLEIKLMHVLANLQMVYSVWYDNIYQVISLYHSLTDLVGYRLFTVTLHVCLPNNHNRWTKSSKIQTRMYNFQAPIFWKLVRYTMSFFGINYIAKSNITPIMTFKSLDFPPHSFHSQNSSIQIWKMGAQWIRTVTEEYIAQTEVPTKFK